LHGRSTPFPVDDPIVKEPDRRRIEKCQEVAHRYVLVRRLVAIGEAHRQPTVAQRRQVEKRAGRWEISAAPGSASGIHASEPMADDTLPLSQPCPTGQGNVVDLEGEVAKIPRLAIVLGARAIGQLRGSGMLQHCPLQL